MRLAKRPPTTFFPDFYSSSGSPERGPFKVHKQVEQTLDPLLRLVPAAAGADPRVPGKCENHCLSIRGFFLGQGEFWRFNSFWHLEVVFDKQGGGSQVEHCPSWTGGFKTRKLGQPRNKCRSLGAA